MDYFNFKQGTLYAEDVPVSRIAAAYGTPLYIYSRATLLRHIRAFEDALAGRPHQICYAVKANNSLTILNLMAKMGLGFDIVSEGELRKVLAAGGSSGRCVFSGVGKTAAEIAFALKQGIGCLNIESEAELEAVARIAADLGLTARVALRVNPNVDAKTHPSISTGLKSNKFGIAFELALPLYQRIDRDPHLEAEGISCHIGSQMTSGAPILEATDRLLALYDGMVRNGIRVKHIDIGGGLGVTYNDETPPSPQEYMSAVIARLHELNVAVFTEPGRAMVANAGILLTRCLYLKQNGAKNFCVVDAGMNDLIRPALYGSRMNIVECEKKAGVKQVYDVVGPVCESDDFLGRDRRLNVASGDLLAVRGAGAYGSSMSSVYNGRPLIPEVMVDGERVLQIRRRQTFEEMWAAESIVE